MIDHKAIERERRKVTRQYRVEIYQGSMCIYIYREKTRD